MKYTQVIIGRWKGNIITIKNMTIMQRFSHAEPCQHLYNTERKIINMHKLDKVPDIPKDNLLPWQQVLSLCIDDMGMYYNEIKLVLQATIADGNIVYGRTCDLSDYAGVKKQASNLFNSQYRIL